MQNAIDLDQKEFEKQLAVGTPQSWNAAMEIYTKGAFSDPIAELNLTQPLANPLSVGDGILGFSTGEASEVKAAVIENYPKGTTIIRVAYDVNQIQENFVGCQVGANPNPKTDGCKRSFSSLFVQLIRLPF